MNQKQDTRLIDKRQILKILNYTIVFVKIIYEQIKQHLGKVKFCVKNSISKEMIQNLNREKRGKSRRLNAFVVKNRKFEIRIMQKQTCQEKNLRKIKRN